MIRQLVNWVRRNKLEVAFDRELQYHLESRMSDLQASGMPAEEARRQTVLELGGIAHVQEELRDVWLSRRIRDFVYYLRFSLRSLYKNAAFSVTAVLSFRPSEKESKRAESTIQRGANRW